MLSKLVQLNDNLPLQRIQVYAMDASFFRGYLLKFRVKFVIVTLTPAMPGVYDWRN